VLRGELSGAEATLALAEPLMAGRLPPWHFGFVARSRLLLEAAALELSAKSGRGRPVSRRSRRNALWAAEYFAWIRPEVWQTVGRLEWLAGRRPSAFRWLGRALDEAERLRMRPDAARVRLAIARHLLEAGAGDFRGRDAATLLLEARREFEALDLAWDLARLELSHAGRTRAAAIR
jgi:hypothetical protein